MTTGETSAQNNSEQIEAWNGMLGAKWVAAQDRLDRMLAPFSAALLKTANVAPSERILDIGCGCGATTLEFARAAGAKGRALGVDISVPMVERARERAAAERSTATFEIADASSHAFTRGSFDVMASRFGVMFFADPAAAFANIRSSLAADGRLVFICWRSVAENGWVTVPLRAALAHVAPPEPAAPGAPGPFAFADAAHVTSILTRAGFRDVAMTPFDALLTLGAGPDALDEAVAQSLEVGPVGRMLNEQPQEVLSRVKESLRSEFAKHVTPEGLALGGAVWIVTARA
ncbi:class I SAM-dependent methyltransferase [Parvibaculum sp.]|uniref:class I SAM-dependent methyltransferase n=1 Tax=Parvibaculum sp. TaxID=2024848 RepID=UPI00320E12F0